MNKLDARTLYYLIDEGETANIDFKQEWHKNNADLVHDILCLSNACENGKYSYLIVGVKDEYKHGEWLICGIAKEGRKKEQK